MDQTNEALNKIAKALTKIAFPKENKDEETREAKIKAVSEHSLLEGLIAPYGWTLSDWQKLSKEEKTEVLNKIKANNGKIV